MLVQWVIVFSEQLIVVDFFFQAAVYCENLFPMSSSVWVLVSGEQLSVSACFP